MYVSSQGGDTTSAAYQGAQLSQQRVSSYVQLVSSRRVSEDVIRELRLPETPEDLSEQITASSCARLGADRRRGGRPVADARGRARQRGGRGVHRAGRRAGAAGRARACRRPWPCGWCSRPRCRSNRRRPASRSRSRSACRRTGPRRRAARSCATPSTSRSSRPTTCVTSAGAPNLGTIAHDSAVPKRPLTVHEDPHSPRSEAFRQLRTNLQFVDVDRPRKVILVTSSMPGEGKTTTLVNLAIAMASAGNRVLVVDADLRRPKVTELLGLERTVGLTSVLSGRVALRAGDPAVGRRSVRRPRQRPAAAEPERAARVQPHGGAAHRPTRRSTTSS